MAQLTGVAKHRALFKLRGLLTWRRYTSERGRIVGMVIGLIFFVPMILGMSFGSWFGYTHAPDQWPSAEDSPGQFPRRASAARTTLSHIPGSWAGPASRGRLRECPVAADFRRYASPELTTDDRKSAYENIEAPCDPEMHHARAATVVRFGVA